MRELSKDTTLCITLAGRPPNIGTRFHGFLYAERGLDYVDKAFATDDISAAIRGVRALGIRGGSVSVPPLRESVIALVDEVEDSGAAIRSAHEGSPQRIAFTVASIKALPIIHHAESVALLTR